jgi:2-aminoethylphosphonate-pyruvate transaminase
VSAGRESGRVPALHSIAGVGQAAAPQNNSRHLHHSERQDARGWRKAHAGFFEIRIPKRRARRSHPNSKPAPVVRRGGIDFVVDRKVGGGSLTGLDAVIKQSDRIAIILAAGLGSRLASVQADKPKGFVEVAGEAIIARSVAALRRAGVRRFVFVVGWRKEFYLDWCARFCPEAVCVENADYASTGSLRSLLLGAAAVPGCEVVVVESDLLYEQRAPERLLAAEGADTVLMSDFTSSRDEVWVHAAETAAGRLGYLSKTRGVAPGPVGELVGLTRMSAGLLAKLRVAAEGLVAGAHYEDGLNAVAAEHPVALLRVPGLAWCEIDDPAHLERARREIWQRIVSAETASRAGSGVMPERKILLNPGPGTTSDAVKRALVVADICPREAEFARVVAQVRRDLLAVAGAEESADTAVLIAGPGTAAMEAAIGSLVPAGGRLLVVDNGAYGERAGQIAAALGVPVEVWRLPWTERPSQVEFAARLDGPAGRFSHAFWVHHETTTGMLNPLAELARECRARGVVSMVDMMSSFAGVPWRKRDSAVDFVIGSANKCLQGMPGVSFVIGPGALIAASAATGRGYALNLARHERSLASGQFPFTPPVQVVYALTCALGETVAETVAGRAARYRACHDLMLAGMEGLGFKPLLPAEWHSGLLTAFHTPDWPGFTFERLHDHLFARGYTLYPGKLPGTDTFRVANIGALTPADLAGFIAETRAFLHAG